MKSIITDFASLAKIARLRALDGRPQDAVVAGIVRAADPNCQKHALPNCSVCRKEADLQLHRWVPPAMQAQWHMEVWPIDTAPSDDREAKWAKVPSTPSTKRWAWCFTSQSWVQPDIERAGDGA